MACSCKCCCGCCCDGETGEQKLERQCTSPKEFQGKGTSCDVCCDLGEIREDITEEGECPGTWVVNGRCLDNPCASECETDGDCNEGQYCCDGQCQDEPCEEGCTTDADCGFFCVFGDPVYTIAPDEPPTIHGCAPTFRGTGGDGVSMYTYDCYLPGVPGVGCGVTYPDFETLPEPPVGAPVTGSCCQRFSQCRPFGYPPPGNIPAEGCCQDDDCIEYCDQQGGGSVLECCETGCICEGECPP